MKILLTQAPFVEICGEFKSYASKPFLRKLMRTIQYFADKKMPYTYGLKDLRKGVRAGSRWPFSLASFEGGFDLYFPFPFIM